MTIGKTPRIYDTARFLYERAVHNEDKIRQITIELDNQIDHARQKFIHQTDTSDTIEIIRAVQEASIEALSAIPSDPTASFTDINRLMSTSAFATEKVIVPVSFGTNTKRAKKIREKIADGTESKSIEIIETLLKDVLPMFSDDGRPHDREHIRGAIQENTAAALLNYRQDGQFIVLPASLEDDVLHGTDLDAYYVAENGKSYKTPISIKSSNRDAKSDKWQHPHLVVISAASFDNQDLSISRLLVRRDEGSPGLNEAEEAKLQAAQQSIYQSFYTQVSHCASAAELPQYPAQETIAKLGQIAI